MEKGQSFPEFALHCARAFGALITMRDEPMDAKIPDKFDPSDYNAKKLTEARRKLIRLLRLNPKMQLDAGKRARNAAIKRDQDWLKKDQEANDRLRVMETAVKAWSAPSPDHAELKKFMLNKIEISKNDCAYILKHLHEVKSKSPMGYFASALESAHREIEYHTREHAEEIDRTKRRNKWISDLRVSLT